MSRKIKKKKKTSSPGRKRTISKIQLFKKIEAAGDIYSSRRDNTAAVEQYLQAWEISPENFRINEKIGNMYARLELYDKAAHYFDLCLKIDSSNQVIKYVLACLNRGEPLDKTPPEWLINTFDGMAGSFEQHLTALRYDIPNKIRIAFEQIRPPETANLHCLDLGCGTGLAGLQFSPLCSRITGVDLSKKMIKEARKKNVYNELLCSDIEKIFDAVSGEFDLFLATDVFVYIGNINNIFTRIKQCAAADAHFLFSIERLDEEHNRHDFKLLPSGRFTHSVDYILTLAHKNNFKIICQEDTVIRVENGREIQGNIFILKNRSGVCAPLTTPLTL